MKMQSPDGYYIILSLFLLSWSNQQTGSAQYRIKGQAACSSWQDEQEVRDKIKGQMNRENSEIKSESQEQMREKH